MTDPGPVIVWAPWLVTEHDAALLSVRADWHDGLDLASPSPGSDPFAPYAGGEMATTAETTQPMEGPLSLAVPGPAPIVGPDAYWSAQDYAIDTSTEDLRARLVELIEREGNLFNCGITCPLKEEPDMTCSACPFHEVGRDTSKSALCRLGKEEERIAALLIAKRASDDN